MLFANALKDYIDHINNLSSLFTDNFSIFVLVQAFFFYVLNSIKLAFIYLISFKWLTDFIELPALFQHQYIAILEGRNFFESSINLNENFFLFLDSSSLNSKNFGTGFINSLFLALPFSVPHLLTIRAFLINGLPAGISAAAGTILGQTLFFTCILFGFEFLILPFLNFESLTLLLGLFLVVNLLYRLIHNPNLKTINISQKDQLFKLFGLNFFLAWTDQTCVFGYFGNLTIDGSPNLLQTSEKGAFFLTQFSYLVGLFVGTVAWTALFFFLVMNLRNFISNQLSTSFVVFNERIHYLTLVLTTIFTLTTIPYYGFDYLFSNSLGFIYNDQTFMKMSPKVAYEVDLKDSQVAVAVDTVPFGKPSDKTTQTLKPGAPGILKDEDYSFESESGWKNRNSLVEIVAATSMDKKVSEKDKPINKSIVDGNQQVEIRNYESSKFGYINEFVVVPLDLREQSAEFMAKQTFRPDIYWQYKTESSNENIWKVHRLFRERYYKNPVYKAFVNFEMAPFLAGQPKNYNLTAEDEFDLFRRRIILQNYLNSVREYKNIKNQGRSFAHKVYNQQFKGSLNIVRHFSEINVKLDDYDPIGNYDSETYLLVSTYADVFKDRTMEKFDEVIDQTLNELKSTYNPNTKEPIKKVLKYDQPLYNENPQNENALLHEELMTKQNKQDKNSKFPTYMLLNDSAPLYVGWDGELRKFLIKTPSIPADSITAQMKSGDVAYDNDFSKLPDYFNFQAWSPALEKTQVKLNSKFQLPSFNISEYDFNDFKTFLGLEVEKVDPHKKRRLVDFLPKPQDTMLKALPKYDMNLRFIDQQLVDSKKDMEFLLDIKKAIPPRLDGIAWPGTIKD